MFKYTGYDISLSELIKENIEIFPEKDPRYYRNDSNKKYLHERLAISKMYDLYKECCANNRHKQQKLHMYKEVFLTHLNLSFFNWKKDTCAQCTGYENSYLIKDQKRLIFREAWYDEGNGRTVAIWRKWNGFVLWRRTSS